MTSGFGSPAATQVCREEAAEFRVTGGSMFPALRPGDCLVVRRSDVQALRPGDLVAFLGPDGRICTHRVRGFENGCPVTWGDAAPAADPPLEPHEILGVVVEVRRGRRSFVPRRVPPFWERAIAQLCRRSVLFHRLALKLWALCKPNP